MKKQITLILALLLLYSCTGEENMPGQAQGELVPTQATLGKAKEVNITRADRLPYYDGTIWITVGGKTAKYALDSYGELYYVSGDPLTIPRTDKQAMGLAAYGTVSTEDYGPLPFHAKGNYDVNWTDNGDDPHVATLRDPIVLTPAAAALKITVKNPAGIVLTGFTIEGVRIYKPLITGSAADWEADGRIKPNLDALAKGAEERDIFATPTALHEDYAMLKITGRTDVPAAPDGYQGRQWIVNVPKELPALEAGKRYNITITLNGEKAKIVYTNIADWTPGTGTYVPKGAENYTHYVSTWDDLVKALAGTGDILQMADITAEDGYTPPHNFTRLYNGNGHTITGLKAPLFNMMDGQVYNLHLRGSEATNSSTDTGLLANWNRGTITLCSATGTGQQTTNGSVGGLVGDNSGTITRSYTDVQVTAGNGEDYISAGGLAGYNNGTIVACAAFGTVEEAPGSTNVTKGTLVGENYVTVAYAYATGHEIGGGRDITVKTAGDVPAYTLVPSPSNPMGISVEPRTFNKNTGNWWSGTGPNDYEIDFTYEGE